MRPLFTGMFCPRDCDRPGSSAQDRHVLRGIDGDDWLVQRVEPDQPIPRGFTRGWWLHKGGISTEDADNSVEDLVELLQEHWRHRSRAPGWNITDEPGINDRKTPMLVFRCLHPGE